MQSVARRRTAGKIYAYDMLDTPWTSAGRPGLNQKMVRGDRERGLYLGFIGFDPQTRTGLHQHQGTAISYFLDGTLWDYGGSAVQGQAGINLAGATHDAIAYGRVLLASRLEGPVTYQPEQTQHELHHGARHAEIVNRAPEVMPDVNVTVDALPVVATSVAGLSRRMVFDYRGTPDDRRMVQLSLLPGTRIPAHLTTALVEWFVVAGDVRVNGTVAQGGSFVVIEPATLAEVSSTYGCILIAWAEGRTEWQDAGRDGRRAPDLYGFG